MTVRLKRGLRWLIGLLVAGFVLLNVVAYRQAYAMTHFVEGHAQTKKPEQLGLLEKVKILVWGVEMPHRVARHGGAELDPHFRPVTLQSAAGVNLAGWIVDAGASHPLVILFHGYGGEKSSMIPQARAFMAMGCSVMLLDFRGSGDSTGNYTSVGYYEADDVAAAVNYAKANLHYSRLVLLGSSMGAAATLRAVAHNNVQPDGIIIESVFDRMLTTVEHRFDTMGLPTFPGAELLVFWGGVQGGFNGFGNNPMEYAPAVRCPILFLHGTDDPRARLEDGRRVFDAVPGSKQFHEFKGLHHQSFVLAAPVEWKQTVGDFLERLPK